MDGDDDQSTLDMERGVRLNIDHNQSGEQLDFSPHSSNAIAGQDAGEGTDLDLALESARRELELNNYKSASHQDLQPEVTPDIVEPEIDSPRDENLDESEEGITQEDQCVKEETQELVADDTDSTGAKDSIVDELITDTIRAALDISDSEEVVEEHTDEMSETPPSAVVKYRWPKFIDTKSNDVGFYPSYAPKSPILLSWDSQERAYFSNDLRIVCGDYTGNLLIDGTLYPVEDFSVRTYTFEVDLFTKDDVLEDELGNIPSQLEQNSVKSVDTYQDLGPLKPSSETPPADSDLTNILKQDKPKLTSSIDEFLNADHKIEDAHVNQESSQEDNILKSETPFSLSSLKRDSPIGNDGAGNFEEPSKPEQFSVDAFFERDSVSQGNRTPLEGLERPLSRSSQDLIDDIVGNSSIKSVSRGSASPAVAAVDEPVRSLGGSRPASVASGSLHGSEHSTNRLEIDAVYGRPLSKTSDRVSPASSLKDDVVSSHLHGSNRETPVRDFTGSRTGASPLHSSMNERVTPSREVSTSNRPSAHASPHSEIVGSSNQINGYHGPSTTPGGGRQDSKPPSRASSHHSSRPQSMSSEQELAQYLDDSRKSSDAFSLPPGISPHPDESLMDPPIMRGLDRPTSVPAYSTQTQTSLDKRSTTPDNRIRIPQASTDYTSFRTSVVTDHVVEVTGRTSVASNASHASSRTITPVSAENGTRETNANRIQDLEASVSNLRKLLHSRESEVQMLNVQVQDLREINKSMKDELEHRSRRHTPVSNVLDSVEYKQLQSEKEILATEVVSLREKVHRLTQEQRDYKPGSGRNSASSGLSDFSPNNPIVLQRKIADLEGHIRDLQEVTESTNSHLTRAEEKLKLLHEENRELKSKSLSYNDLRTDRDQHGLQVELRTLREDLRNLKERNYQLTEENMKLSESQTYRSKETHGGGARLSSSLRSDDEVVRHASNYSSSTTSHRRDPATATTSTKTYHKSSHLDLAPRSLRHSDLRHSYEPDQRTSESARLLQQRNPLLSSRLQFQPKEIPSTSKSSDAYNKTSSLYTDRSRPDGEGAEKIHTDHYGKTTQYEKVSYDDILKDRSSSYLDKQAYNSSRGRDPHEQRSKVDSSSKFREDKYIRMSDISEDRDSKQAALNRVNPGRGALSSRDIYNSLQQKRARQWLQQDNKYISGNIDFQRYQPVTTAGRVDDPADDSDTATDILLAQETTPRGSLKPQQPVLGSDGSLESLSDVDDVSDSVLRRRSKSVEPNRGEDSSRTRQLSTLTRSGSATRPLTSIDNMRGSAGHRSVVPTPLTTQHNKGEKMAANPNSFLSSSLTQGMRPFAPRNPGDIRPEDVVKFSRLGGKLTQGVVKYVGHLPGRSEAYLGVELDKDEGKHDGTFEGIRYFKCKSSKGVFVAFNKVVMAWAP